MFVTFDFKDLYTNILFNDAQRVIKDCCETFGVGDDELHLILDLYNFCNDCNYFNVGNVFKANQNLSGNGTLEGCSLPQACAVKSEDPRYEFEEMTGQTGNHAARTNDL